MRKHIVEYVFDRESGERGFRVVGMPQIEGEITVGDGRLMAHDLLEHLDGVAAVGSVADEILALGALWHVRGDREVTPQGLASDLAVMASKWIEGEREFLPSGHQSRLRALWAEHALAFADAEARREFLFEDKYVCECPDEREKRAYHLDAFFWPYTLPLMRQGFARARKRYYGINVNGIFNELQRQLTAWQKSAYEGRRFVVRIDLKREFVRVTPEEEGW